MSTENPKSNPKEPARKLTGTALLSHLYDGAFAKEVDEAHRDMTEQMMTRRGKGKIVITLNYSAPTEGGINVTPDIVVTKPKKSRRTVFTFADERGTTYIDDPRQTEMELEKPLIQFEPAKAANQ